MKKKAVETVSKWVAFEKSKRIIESCKTSEQVNVALKYIENFYHMYHDYSIYANLYNIAIDKFRVDNSKKASEINQNFFGVL